MIRPAEFSVATNSRVDRHSVARSASHRLRRGSSGGVTGSARAATRVGVGRGAYVARGGTGRTTVAVGVGISMFTRRDA